MNLSTVKIKIRYNSDWREYTVTPSDNPAASYHTDDLLDAFLTASVIKRREYGNFATIDAPKRLVDKHRKLWTKECQ